MEAEKSYDLLSAGGRLSASSANLKAWEPGEPVV